MLYLTYVPGLPLGEFVDYFWLFDGGQAPRKERIVPSGTSELVINLRDDEIRIHHPAYSKHRRLSGAVLSGTYSSTLVVDAMQHESMLGVHFKPGGAFAFLGAPASEVTDTHADLADLWGRPANQLRERLSDAVAPRDRFQIMEQVLMDRLRRSPKRRQAIVTALDAFGPYGTGATVRDVAREVDLCQRRFRKLFASQVGLTPKIFCRILRFQRVRTMAKQIEKPDWAQIASTCGYFDQSHLINDFREFSDFSPTEYLRRQREHLHDLRLKSHHMPLTG